MGVWEMRQGIVFNVQRYSIDDGPGIRTVVFLKGCPLRCRWCANPESQRMGPQILFNAERCQHCGKCAQVCPNKGASCAACGACAEGCWHGARTLCGESWTVERVMDAVLRDVQYYRRNGGGVTLSGGEPLMQGDFAAAILERCRAEGIHTAIETAGCVPWSALEAALKNLDLVFFDCKHVDEQKHRAFTGVDNALILENLEHVLHCFENVVVRVPCIPGFNAAEEDVEQILKRLKEMGAREVELLPFHRFGSGKYRELGTRYEYEEIPPMRPDELAFAGRLGEKYGLDVRVKERRG